MIMNKKSIFIVIILLINFKSFAMEIYARDFYKNRNSYVNKVPPYLFYDGLLEIHLWKILIKDLFTTSNELIRISTVGSINPTIIKITSKIGNIFHKFSIFELIWNYNYAYICQNDSSINYTQYKVCTSLYPINQQVTLARWLQLLPSIFALKFIKYDNNIKDNAEIIAQNNKNNKRDLSNIKRKQYLWLAANKLLPYLGFACLRKFYDQNSLKNIFNIDLSKRSNLPSIQYLEIFKALADISEIMRKYSRYKSEVENY